MCVTKTRNVNDSFSLNQSSLGTWTTEWLLGSESRLHARCHESQVPDAMSWPWLHKAPVNAQMSPKREAHTAVWSRHMPAWLDGWKLLKKSPPHSTCPIWSQLGFCLHHDARIIQAWKSALWPLSLSMRLSAWVCTVIGRLLLMPDCKIGSYALQWSHSYHMKTIHN